MDISRGRILQPHFKLVVHKHPHSFNFAVTHCFYHSFLSLFKKLHPIPSIKPNLLFPYFENLQGINPTRTPLPLQDPSLPVPTVSFSQWDSLDFYFCIHDPYDKCHLNSNKRGANKWNTILKKHFKGI